jgi:peptidoglycan/LPS O-acetylase OafA/YrhL
MVDEKSVAKSNFEFNLEALRGFVALVVVLTHCVGFSSLLNGTKATGGIWAYEFPGHFAVLIFFILSGYVIGLTTKKQLSWQTCSSYLKKRLLRLYPIYAICILLGLLITLHHYSLTAILSNLTFFQRVTAPPIDEVGVIWSLNYEALFYLLFIPISIYALKPSHVFFGSLALAFFFQFAMPIKLLAMYGFGFCFWVAGLWLSRTDYVRSVKTSRYTLAGLLCLMLTFSSLNFARELLIYQLHSDTMRGEVVPVSVLDIMCSDFSYLPLGVLLITYFVNKRIRYNSSLVAFVLAVPVLYLAVQLYHGQTRYVDYPALLLPCAFYMLGILLLALGKIRPEAESNRFPKFMVTLGSISYGIYLLHYIIILLISRIPFLYGAATTFLARSLGVLLLTLAGGYLLEKVWHPFAVHQLKRIGF